jgi:hypothetical protein
MLLAVRKVWLYASHHQFYVMDSDPDGDTGERSFWSEQACRNELATTDGIIGIGTASYGTVEVIVQVHDEKPPGNPEPWDHVTEAGLNVSSGTLRVVGCPELVGPDFEVTPDHYRVRCCHANRAGSVHNGGKGQDWYLIQVWPDQPSPACVLKSWRGK